MIILKYQGRHPHIAVRRDGDIQRGALAPGSAVWRQYVVIDQQLAAIGKRCAVDSGVVVWQGSRAQHRPGLPIVVGCGAEDCAVLATAEGLDGAVFVYQQGGLNGL